MFEHVRHSDHDDDDVVGSCSYYYYWYSMPARSAWTKNLLIFVLFMANYDILWHAHNFVCRFATSFILENSTSFTISNSELDAQQLILFVFCLFIEVSSFNLFVHFAFAFDSHSFALDLFRFALGKFVPYFFRFRFFFFFFCRHVRRLEWRVVKSNYQIIEYSMCVLFQ